MSSLLACRADSEGWGPVSRIRPFDLTPCFEESAVLSPLFIVFVACAVVASAVRRGEELHKRSRKSVWVLRAKLVSLNLV